jgi:hypothetical protein
VGTPEHFTPVSFLDGSTAPSYFGEVTKKLTLLRRVERWRSRLERDKETKS